MKFDILLANLKSALNIVKDALGNGSQGHEGIRLYVGKKGRIKLSATDGEYSIETWTEASKVTATGKAVVKGKKFIQYIQHLDVEKVSLFIKDNGSLTVKSKRGQQSFQSFDESTFVSPPKYDAKESFNVSGRVLKEIVNSVSFAAQKDSNRPILEGINIHSTGKNIEVMTTNGITIANFKKKLKMPKMNITVMKDPLANAAKIAADDQKITMQLCNNTRFLVKVEDTTYHIPLLAGKYPDMSKIIPSDYDFECAIEKEDFISMLTRAQSMLDTAGTLSFDKDKISISGQAEDGEFNEYIVANLQGKKTSVKLDMKRLHETVKHIQSDNIVVGFRKHKPLCIRPDTKLKQTCLISTIGV